MIKKLQKRYALSEQGAKDLVKGCLACVLQNLSFMIPVWRIYESEIRTLPTSRC